jgi:hypothetical protein
MSKSTAVEKTSTETAVAVNQDEINAILAAQDEEFQDAQFQTPILKVCQALTKEVKEGDAEAGEFLNTLTGESYGTKVEFVVAHAQRGRAASSSDGRYYVAIGQDTIPESWADLVGEEFVGTPFSEYPDAEEQFKARVNRKEIEWGKGPLISTTYNYTGLAIPSAIDGSDEEVEPMPVRIAFLRSTKSAHDKLQTLKRATLRNKPFWNVVFEFSTKSKSFGRNDAFVVNVRKTRDSTPEEKSLATELALAVAGGRTVDNAEAAEAGSAPVAPDAKGGLAV